MKYKVISTGSKGNAVLYHGCILVDIGVSFSLLEEYLWDIKLILLTHHHSDHFNMGTLKRVMEERPTLRLLCPVHMTRFIELSGNLSGNIDICDIGCSMDYGDFVIIPVQLYHDCENFGYRIIHGNYKIFHATDTHTLEGIEARNYDLLAVEHNYDEDQIHDSIKKKQENGQYVYEHRALNTHLSEQKAREFIYKNKGPNTKVLRLHQSDKY